MMRTKETMSAPVGSASALNKVEQPRVEATPFGIIQNVDSLDLRALPRSDFDLDVAWNAQRLYRVVAQLVVAVETLRCGIIIYLPLQAIRIAGFWAGCVNVDERSIYKKLPVLR
jgi:hypothetical protein